MEPEPDTGEDQLMDEVFQYITTMQGFVVDLAIDISSSIDPDCKEGRKRVIRTKAKQFEEITRLHERPHSGGKL